MKPSFLLHVLLGAGLAASAAAQQASPVSTKPATTDAAKDEAVELSPFLVRTDRDRGYSGTTALGASRVALPVSDIPVSVISLTEQFFLDRAAIDGMEVLPFVSGIQVNADGAPGQAGYSLRGYANVGLRIRDGLPEKLEGVDYAFDDGASYERLEVIKGPAGTLYGTTSMGGVVNKISKWPKFTPQTKLELQAQSYDEFVRGIVDTTGPLDENTAYRAVLSSRVGRRYYNDEAPNDFTTMLLAFTHRVGADRSGRIWARAHHFRFELDRENGPQFITGYLDGTNPSAAPLVRDPKFAVPIDAHLTPDGTVSIANNYSYEGGYEQTFAGPLSGDWTVRLVGRFTLGKGDKSPSGALSNPVPVDANGAIVRYTNAAGALVNGDFRFISAADPRVADWRSNLTMREFSGYNKGSGAYLDLVGAFATGPLEHKMVINAQLDRAEFERAFFFWPVLNPSNTTAVANSFSLLRPDYSGYSLESTKAARPTQFNAFNGHSASTGFAGGFQDNINVLDDRLIAVIGARYDNVDTTSYTFHSAQSIAQGKFVKDPATVAQVGNQEWTFRYGLVGKPLRGLSVFAQVGETYIPINRLDSSGVKFPNQLGEIKEAGIKLDLFGTRLVATASVFDMELTNVLISVPNPPELGGGLVTVPAGTQTSDGFEIDLTGEPVRGLNVSLAYSNLTSTNEAGRSFRGVPISAAWSVLGKYRFQEGSLKGLFVGASWRHNGQQAGDATNTFYLDSADHFDGFTGYGRGRWGVQLNVLNLTDTDDIAAVVGNTAVFRALPRMYRVTFRYTF